MLVTVLGSDFSADVSLRQRRREDRLDLGVQRSEKVARSANELVDQPCSKGGASPSF